jgi:hypothetical protein
LKKLSGKNRASRALRRRTEHNQPNSQGKIHTPSRQR